MTTITITLPRAAAQQALEALEAFMEDSPRPYDAMRGQAAITALRAALAQQAEPVQEPWSTRERFYEAIDRAVEAVRQEMKVKTVTMLLPEYDITLPIIDARSGRVLVGPVVPAPPQRKPLTDEEIAAEWQKASECASKSEAAVTTSQFVQMFARAIERAHGIGGSNG